MLISYHSYDIQYDIFEFKIPLRLSNRFFLKSPDSSSNLSNETPRDELYQDESRTQQPLQLEEVQVDEGSPEVPPSTTLPKTTQTEVVKESGRSKTWEILKSIVYGGLNQSIASLNIVISSASSDATTLNIIVMSLANLIGGLSILVHNVLGKREDFFLHVCMATDITAGIYHTFSESNNKDLKLAAVLGASAICITFLSIAKAHIQRPNTHLTYLKTVLSNLSSVGMASIVSYLAGALFLTLLKSLDSK
ncbi:hypothetical protein K1719_032754 [Acacia pycnantha]|nr:hypothetical protein K1719_032754 [Acacia pycnantha]